MAPAKRGDKQFSERDHLANFYLDVRLPSETIGGKKIVAEAYAYADAILAERAKSKATEA